MKSPYKSVDEILNMAGNLAMKTVNQYLDEDLKLGLLERLKLPEETNFSGAKAALLKLILDCRPEKKASSGDTVITTMIHVREQALDDWEKEIKKLFEDTQDEG